MSRSVFLPFLVLVLLLTLVALAGCQSMRDGLGRVTGPLAENGTRASLSIGIGVALFFLVPGSELLRVGIASLGTYVTQAMTTEPTVIAQAAPAAGMPWYLDPMAYARLALNWLVVAVVVGLLFPRSRQQTLAFLRDTVTGHPILGARRFAAGMGWLHSDPVPSKTDRLQIATRLSKDTT